MKFDVVIGNPPYNGPVESRLVQENNKRLVGGPTLGKTFIKYMLGCSCRYVIALQPYSGKTYGKGTQKAFKDSGLFKVEKVTGYFSIAQEVGAFYFDKTSRNVDVEDAFITRTVPSDNLAKYFIRTAGRLPRHQYEDTLLETGDIQVVITPSRVKYTNDEHFNLRMQDATVKSWRVVMPVNGSRNKIGNTLVVEPGTILSNSVACLVVSCEEDAFKLKAYLDSSEVNSMIALVKTTASNAAKYFEYIPTPSFLLK